MKRYTITVIDDTATPHVMAVKEPIPADCLDGPGRHFNLLYRLSNMKGITTLDPEQVIVEWIDEAPNYLTAPAPGTIEVRLKGSRGLVVTLTPYLSLPDPVFTVLGMEQNTGRAHLLHERLEIAQWYLDDDERLLVYLQRGGESMAGMNVDLMWVHRTEDSVFNICFKNTNKVLIILVEDLNV
jgi:hypothetical protein